MPRRGERQKHPALAAKYTQDMERLMREQDDALIGWETFTKSERKFLAMLPYHKNYSETVRFMGMSLSWLNKQMARKPLLRLAAQNREGYIPRLLELMLQDMLPRSAMVMQEIIDNDGDKKLQMDAIKHLHRITGVSKEEVAPGVTIGQKIDKQQIIMFGKEQPQLEEASRDEQIS